MAIQATGQNTSAGVPSSGVNKNEDGNQNERTENAASTAFNQAQGVNKIPNATESNDETEDDYLARTRARAITQLFMQGYRQYRRKSPLDP